jgi:phosphatidate cytidylyltransferase
MLLRVISALILVPAVIALVLLATPLYFVIAVGMIGTACLFEYFRIVHRMGLPCQPWFGYAAFWLLLGGLAYRVLPALMLFACVLLVAFLAAMWRGGPMKERVLGLMAGMLGVFYSFLFLAPVVAVRFDFGSDLGKSWLLILLAVIWAGDTAALLIGKKFGRHLFSPQLSPKKTNEGAAAGLLAGMGVAILMQHFLFTGLPLKHVIVVSLLLGMFGQLGDLAESMLKRAAEVKDSSNIIPGHGGVLDRIDSLLFSFPVLYLYLLLLYPSL